MTTSVAVAYGLGAAALFAAGTALQYRSMASPTSSEDPSVLWSWTHIRSVVSSRVWVAGTALLCGGLTMHALALHLGPMTLVQPILMTGVLFALPASRFADGTYIDRGDMWWAVVLVASLSAFLITATPASQKSKDIDSGPALLAFIASLAGIGVCLLLARRLRGRATATVVGMAAGIALAGSAALIKVSTDILVRKSWSVIASWQLYATVGVGLLGLVLSQMAYRSGPMTASLPAINSVDPLVSVLIGWAVFDEKFRIGLVPIVLEGVSLGAVVVATAALTRRAARKTAIDRDRAVSDRGFGRLGRMRL